MCIESRLISVDVIWRLMSDFVETKAENYKELLIVKLHQNLSKKK